MVGERFGEESGGGFVVGFFVVVVGELGAGVGRLSVECVAGVGGEVGIAVSDCLQ